MSNSKIALLAHGLAVGFILTVAFHFLQNRRSRPVSQS
jgi:hypothetical protein